MMLLLAAAMSASIHQRGAAAQTASIKKGDELRPIYVTPADVADGKQFADSACAGCHGANGISTTTGIPDLAGQRPVYLYLAAPGLSIRRPHQRRHEYLGEVHQRRRAGQGGGVLRKPRPTAAAGRRGADLS